MTRLDSNCTFIPPTLRLLYPASGVLMGVRRADPVMAVQESYGPAKEEADGDRRYQILFIAKGDTVSAFWTDLGPASDFLMEVEGMKRQAPPYFQLVLGEHDVAECLHMAETGRYDDYAIRLLNKQVDESDLFAKYQQLIEEDLAVVRNRSVSGPGGMFQRNGYSRTAAREQQERMATAWR